ncbi:ribosome biogenesis GTP-binding protein YihA/YsxC [Nosocomiicoccus ampullae]|uniref:Probable GTP-binding protein EngB n=1 Tax=Nosocomiicoccus ampullae TaxID=489910 RepID=A0A9Q2CYW1_9STAP|nr:ribosome biogenesis GTP-binding protein YihA/YsxC [Nosocomiicoccus ampullae]MBB5175334.1 GTP-binding protein [Nosocomiicoccus ampullae]QYA46295.1 ribosome biogenesis GTP-binding protein YihA/YsxC [Nosocomiicoccus ampullae]QYA47794.1 ribosome biogenesis GTP-binding protein YihA/YsxC [Nosocomiicoccus ampullae]
MKLNPNNIEFLISAVQKEQYPKTGLKEVAMAGRSNVGKSSFINAITGRKNIARISSKPGKTVTLNFYNADDQFVFVDVPGYGYAKQSKKEREKWAEMIENYFIHRETLETCVQIIDLRHPPTEDDILMYDFLKQLDIKTIIVATKSDKISKSRLQKHVSIIRKELELEDEDVIIPFSSTEKYNVDKVLHAIEERL